MHMCVCTRTAAQRGVLSDCMGSKSYLCMLCCHILTSASPLWTFPCIDLTPRPPQSFGFPVNPQDLTSTGDLWLVSGQLTY